MRPGVLLHNNYEAGFPHVHFVLFDLGVDRADYCEKHFHNQKNTSITLLFEV